MGGVRLEYKYLGKKSGLPKEVLDEYARQCGRDKGSSSDDDEPIAKKLKRGALHSKRYHPPHPFYPFNKYLEFIANN
jgi:hypothetical protein